VGTNYNPTNSQPEPTVVGKSINVASNLIRFCLAVFLWSHAFFLLNIQSRIAEYIRGRVHVTTAEAILFVLLLTFSFVAGSGFGQTFVNLVYIYFFPFVLLFYAVYWPIRALRILKLKAARSAGTPPGSLVVQASPSSVVLTAPHFRAEGRSREQSGSGT